MTGMPRGTGDALDEVAHDSIVGCIGDLLPASPTFGI
jgi:hypothetical protein